MRRVLKEISDASSLQAAKRRLAEEQALLVQRIELYAEEIMAAQNSASPTPPEQP
jgi:hypothetical protein